MEAVMIQKISLMWAQDKSQIAVVILGLAAVAALYAAFLS
jgi:hypothetical protein